MSGGVTRCPWWALMLTVFGVLLGGCSVPKSELSPPWNDDVRKAVLATPGVAGGSVSLTAKPNRILDMALATRETTTRGLHAIGDKALRAAADTLRRSGYSFDVNVVITGVGVPDLSSRDLTLGVRSSSELYRRFPGGFAPSMTPARLAELEPQLQQALLEVKGVSDGAVTLRDEGPKRGIWLRFEVTSTDTSGSGRRQAMDEVLQRFTQILWPSRAAMELAVEGTVNPLMTTSRVNIYSGFDLWVRYEAFAGQVR